jgi:hypothetical protein
MLDELLDERRRDFLHEAHQKQLIARYCSDLENQLKNAPDRDQARALVDASCRDFAQSCPSGIVRRFLISHAEHLFRRQWDSP